MDLLKSAKKPLVILGKGAAYAQADAEIRAFVEKSGIPYLPMSMAKGLLPDNHSQSASAARSYVLAEADVVMLVGARLNWLLSHGKGKTWGAGGSQGTGQASSSSRSTSPRPRPDSNVAIAAPVIGDIGSCIAALQPGHGLRLGQAAGRLDGRASPSARTRTSPRWPRRWRRTRR